MIRAYIEEDTRTAYVPAELMTVTECGGRLRAELAGYVQTTRGPVQVRRLIVHGSIANATDLAAVAAHFGYTMGDAPVSDVEGTAYVSGLPERRRTFSLFKNGDVTDAGPGTAYVIDAARSQTTPAIGEA